MDSEFGGLTEGLAALFAFIGLLSSVNSYVYYEVRGRTEGFPTFLTFIRFITAVDPFVLGE